MCELSAVFGETFTIQMSFFLTDLGESQRRRKQTPGPNVLRGVGQRMENRNRRTEHRNENTEDRTERAEVRKAEVRKAEVRKSEIGSRQKEIIYQGALSESQRLESQFSD